MSQKVIYNIVEKKTDGLRKSEDFLLHFSEAAERSNKKCYRSLQNKVVDFIQRITDFVQSFILHYGCKIFRLSSMQKIEPDMRFPNTF